ncbi:hypothetical protein [Alkalihalobacillus sp. BA299]|uniref:hypothetical protein n=1 Tax=Alkalihalobacillus sp. BA299 TaxID=2815938 RepID=UPI001ADCE69A|nr:hypothetical protein [Alkalihalobacillus sp. BA299]
MKEKRKIVVGNPQKVIQQLYDLKTMYEANEVMIVTITHSYEDRLKSYELIANEWMNDC